MSNVWYYEILGEEFGPTTWEHVVELHASGTLGDADLVREEHSADPVRLGSLLLDDGTDFVTGLGATVLDPAVQSELDSGGATTATATHHADRSVHSADTDHGFVGTDTDDDLSIDDFEIQSESEAEAPVLPGDVADVFYCKSQGTIMGPMSMVELVQIAESGSLSGDDQIRKGHMGRWLTVTELPELMVAIVLVNNDDSESSASSPASNSAKKREYERPTGSFFTEIDTASPAATDEATSARLDAAHAASPAARSDSGAQKNRRKKTQKPAQSRAARELQRLRAENARLKQASQRASELEQIFGEVFADDVPAERPASSPAAPAVPRLTPQPVPSHAAPPRPVPQPPRPTPQPQTSRPTPPSATTPLPIPRKTSTGLIDVLIGLVPGGGTLIVGSAVLVLGVLIYFAPSMFSMLSFSPSLPDQNAVTSTLNELFQEYESMSAGPSPDDWQTFGEKVRTETAEFLSGYRAAAGSRQPRDIQLQEAATALVQIVNCKADDTDRQKQFAEVFRTKIQGS